MPSEKLGKSFVKSDGRRSKLSLFFTGKKRMEKETQRKTKDKAQRRGEGRKRERTRNLS